MRDIIIKASMIAGAALLVTACGETATNNTAANTMGGEYNTTDTMGNMGDMNTMGTTMDSNTSMDGGNMSGNISVNTSTGNVSGNVSTNGM